MSDTSQWTGSGNRSSVPPYRRLTWPWILRRDNLSRAGKPKLTGHLHSGSQDARGEIDRYRDQVDALRKKTDHARTNDRNDQVPEFGL